ncbi:hypothetical protein A7X67_05110 [Clostridium sp. W14A]|nr:hypothetical protein A7X67_05110 [Clostridium sp. W14A]
MSFQRRNDFNSKALKFSHTGKRLTAVTMNMEQAGDKESVKTSHVSCLYQLFQFSILIKINAYSGNLISQLFRKIIKLLFLFL